MNIECPQCKQPLRVASPGDKPVRVQCRHCGTTFSTANAVVLMEMAGDDASTSVSDAVNQPLGAIPPVTHGGVNAGVTTGADDGGWKPVVAPHRAAQQTATGRSRMPVASAGAVIAIVIASFFVRGALRVMREVDFGGGGGGGAPAPREVKLSPEEEAEIQRVVDAYAERRRKWGHKTSLTRPPETQQEKEDPLGIKSKP